MSKVLKVFIGFDPRQPIAYQVLSHSILRRSSVPVSITPLVLSTLPIRRRGLTEFTYSRYLVPWLCSYEGKALFLDADMLCLGDIAELFSLGDSNKSVHVVKNKLKFEWPSLMLFNNFHCDKLSSDYVDNVLSKPQSFEWANDVGELPAEWNHIVGYDNQRTDAKLVHFTAGIPCWTETRDCEYSEEWNREAYQAVSSVSWQELMGESVHAKRAYQGFK